ncbi:hypothetical protein [Saccharopolyspora erythraea]|uniref:hypothetical protein n=1 Tax=Saccharopolyspora erythraea TaxID=1836 RepID=UPI00038D9220|nr:hypothetical protein [Saccharopolyspora erythraea]EQD84911.1 hypothetical protein N599_17540 [Saccharopolyspora erythraea D]
MPPRPRFRWMALLIAGLLVLAGCVGGPAGSGPVAGGGKPSASSAGVLGDLRTFDPCSVADPAALARFGQVTDAGTVSLDYCLHRVQLADGSVVQVAVGELAESTPDQPGGGAPVVARGQFRVRQEPPLPGHCARDVLFDDGIAMRVSADLLSGDPGAGLCAVAETGADAAVGAMQQHRAGHRAYPPDSLAVVDPYTVLDSAVVHEVPGLEQTQPRSTPARHQCQWGEQNAESPRVRLVHTAGDPPRVLHGAAVEEEIAGRRTVVSIVGGDPSVPLCSAETGHIPFGDPAGRQVEVAMLVVAVPGADGIEACEYARGLAQSAWPRLPSSGGSG